MVNPCAGCSCSGCISFIHIVPNFNIIVVVLALSSQDRLIGQLPVKCWPEALIDCTGDPLLYELNFFLHFFGESCKSFGQNVFFLYHLNYLYRHPDPALLYIRYTPPPVRPMHAITCTSRARHHLFVRPVHATICTSRGRYYMYVTCTPPPVRPVHATTCTSRVRHHMYVPNTPPHVRPVHATNCTSRARHHLHVPCTPPPVSPMHGTSEL